MFASRVNKLLKRCVSWKNDPDAEDIDARDGESTLSGEQVNLMACRLSGKHYRN